MRKSPSPRSNRLLLVFPWAILVLSSPGLSVDPLSENDSVPVTDIAELIKEELSRDIASMIVVDLIFTYVVVRSEFNGQPLGGNGGSCTQSRA